jgi:hypothetical protein
MMPALNFTNSLLVKGWRDASSALTSSDFGIRAGIVCFNAHTIRFGNVALFDRLAGIGGHEKREDKIS